MNERILKQQLGIHQKLKLVDLCGATASSDSTMVKDLSEYIDMKEDDMIFIISFRETRTKKQLKRGLEQMMKRLSPKRK